MAKAKAKAKGKGKKKGLTKSALLAHLAEKTEVPKADVIKVFDALTETIIEQLGSVKQFTLPGLFKMKAAKKDAVKGGIEKPNPLKPGQTYITQDKPASTKVTARPLKALKAALAPAPK